MTDEKKSNYTAAPEVPEEVRARFQLILEVLSGVTSVSEAARRLGMSRNHFQTLMHRGLGSMVEAITPKSGGRPPKPQREAQLEEENEQLRKENDQLSKQNQMVQRLLNFTSDVVKGRVQPSRRTAKTPETKASEGESSDQDEPDGGRRERLEDAMALRSLGLRPLLAAALVGAAASTVRRWRARSSRGEPLAAFPRARRKVEPAKAAVAEKLIRELRGAIGADALRHAVPGLSRRGAAQVKSVTLTAIERERIEACERIRITVPGVVRGFDAMHVNTTAGRQYALIAADAAVQYRTIAVAAARYDSASVASTLRQDIERNGAPLIYRMDRASVHRTPEVKALLKGAGVLVVHGPPHHPYYYGQLERQNREHRVWLPLVDKLQPTDLQGLYEEMLARLNAQLPRRSLAWQTAETVWKARAPLVVDRRELREEVTERAARIREQLTVEMQDDVVERFAIEATLMKRGWLNRAEGGWC